MNRQVQQIDVGGWSLDPKETGTPQRVFGALIQLAIPVITNYHSDLYHDALTIEKWFTPNPDDPKAPWEPLTFVYVTRENGTHMTNDPNWSKAVVDSALHERNSHIYSCAVVTVDNGKWWLLVSEMEKP